LEHQREKIIKEYFKAWLKNESHNFDDIFSKGIYYSECYGPKYRGIEEIKRWFLEWNKIGRVLNWDILSFIHSNEKTVVEWYFRCDYKNEIGEFKGVSIIDWEEGKISSVKEFQSSLPQYFYFKD